MACQDAKDRGFDEALLLDVDGYIAEGPGANIFFELGGKLITPERGSILPGITRATILDICIDLELEVEERKILPQEIMGADSAFFCGTAAEVIGIKTLDRVPFKKDWDASKGFLIQRAYKKLVLGKDYSLLVA
jgi:branched-chain amino acid aminotransferase